MGAEAGGTGGGGMTTVPDGTTGSLLEEDVDGVMGVSKGVSSMAGGNGREE